MTTSDVDDLVIEKFQTLWPVSEDRLPALTAQYRRALEHVRRDRLRAAAEAIVATWEYRNWPSIATVLKHTQHGAAPESDDQGYAGIGTYCWRRVPEIEAAWYGDNQSIVGTAAAEAWDLDLKHHIHEQAVRMAQREHLGWPAARVERPSLDEGHARKFRGRAETRRRLNVMRPTAKTLGELAGRVAAETMPKL